MQATHTRLGFRQFDDVLMKPFYAGQPFLGHLLGQFWTATGSFIPFSNLGVRDCHCSK